MKLYAATTEQFGPMRGCIGSRRSCAPSTRPLDSQLGNTGHRLDNMLIGYFPTIAENAVGVELKFKGPD